MATGMVLLALSGLVLVGADEDAQRVNQTQLHKYRTGFQTVGQGYRLWPKAKQQTEAEDFQRSAPVNLNAFRSRSTATNRFISWRQSPQGIQPEDDATRVAQYGLHRFRTSYQTVGQSWFMRRPAQQRIDAEDYQVLNVGTFAGQQGTAQAAVPGQPWFMRMPAQKRVDAEEYLVLNRGAAAGQQGAASVTPVGQSYRLWPIKVPRIEAEDYVIPKPVDLTLFRVQPSANGVPQYVWVPPVVIEPEDYESYRRRSLLPFRQFSAAVLPGQPWHFWKQTCGTQEVEPNPVVTAHGLALYPFRPHQAITPAPTVDALTGGTNGPLHDFTRKGIHKKKRLEEVAAAVAEVIAAAEPEIPINEPIKAAKQPKFTELSMGKLAAQRELDRLAKEQRRQDDDDDAMALFLLM